MNMHFGNDEQGWILDFIKGVSDWVARGDVCVNMQEVKRSGGKSIYDRDGRVSDLVSELVPCTDLAETTEAVKDFTSCLSLSLLGKHLIHEQISGDYPCKAQKIFSCMIFDF